VEGDDDEIISLLFHGSPLLQREDKVGGQVGATLSFIVRANRPLRKVLMRIFEREEG